MSRSFNVAEIGRNVEVLQAESISAVCNLSQITFAAWVKWRGVFNPYSGYGSVFVKDATGVYTASLALSDNFAGGALLNTDIATGDTLDFAGLVSNESIPVNTWVHVASVWNQADGVPHGYINGVEVTYQQLHPSTNAPRTDFGGPLQIGDDSYGAPWYGDIAEVAIWNMAFSSSDIAALAASTTGAGSIHSSNLVAYYHLTGVQNPEPDSSSNNNSAILSNTPCRGVDSPGFTS